MDIIIKIIGICSLCVFLLTSALTSFVWYMYIDMKPKEIEYVNVEVEKRIDFELLADAISFVENKQNKSDAIGDNGKAVGVMQIWKTYVDEVNRLEGYQKYNYEDRFDRDKSKAMFIDMNKHKNPNSYLHLAIKIHNPKAKLSYHKEIEEKYEELIKNKQINYVRTD